MPDLTNAHFIYFSHELLIILHSLNYKCDGVDAQYKIIHSHIFLAVRRHGINDQYPLLACHLKFNTIL